MNIKALNVDDLRIACLPHIIYFSLKTFLKSLIEVYIIPINDKIPTNNASNLIQMLRFIVKKLCSSLQQRKQFSRQ